jgi:hypothetical protein
MNLQPLYGRAGEIPALPRRVRSPAGDRALTPEVVARVMEAVSARPVEDLPSAYAEPIYSMLVAHGFDRRDVLALAASLVDLVTSEVKVPSSSPDIG